MFEGKARLREFWVQAHGLCALVPTARSEHVFADILVRLAEPHRRYHQIDHIVEACEVFEELASQDANIQHRGVGLFALIFHDIVYEIGAGDNEKRSADYAREKLAQIGASEPSVGLVSEIIEATATHSYSGSDVTVKACLDAGMSILGMPPEKYARYVWSLRQEFGQVDEEAWKKGRGMFLATTLAAPIYLTGAASRLYEEQARENIRRELGALTA